MNTSSSSITGRKGTCKRLFFQNKCSLKSHMDNVRGLHFLPSVNGLISASEDCTMKIWDVKQFAKLSELENNIEPYLTLRGHLSPIFCLTGSCATAGSPYENVIYSASQDGVIKAWHIPPRHEIEPYSNNQEKIYYF